MLGLVAGVYDYNWKEAEHRFRLALAHEPVPAQVRWWHGWFNLVPNGRIEEAVEEAKQTVQGDPLNTMSRIMLADCLTAAHRYQEAFEELHRALELDENSWFVCALLAENYLTRGMLLEGLMFAEKAYLMAPWAPNSRATFAALLAKNGQRSRANEVLQQLKETSETYGVPRDLFYFHALCGEFDQATQWAEKAIEQRDVAVALMMRLLASSPRWPELASKMNLLPA
jgi:tetratricopeptide (TPR) repeat protein